MSLPPLVNPAGDDPRKVAALLNQATRRLMSVGPTADRPKQPTEGQMHVDTTLGTPVWYINTAWRNAAGVAV